MSTPEQSSSLSLKKISPLLSLDTQLHLYHGVNLSCQNSFVEALPPNVMVFGDGLWEIISFR